jgi:drug/metabolite transporter (DMT)-like permease
MISSSNKEYSLAVSAILFSAAMWGLIWYPMRLLEQAGMPVVWTTMTAYLAAAVVATAQLLWIRKRITHLWPPTLWALALAAGLTNLAFLVALIEGEVVRVMLLFYLSPLWSVLLGHWWLGERISRQSLMMILIAMSGTFMMLWHPEIGFPWPHGLADWLALFASFMFSVNNVLSRKLAVVPMEIKTFAVYWGVVMVAIAVLFLQQASVPQVEWDIWLLVTVFGGLAFVSMTIAVLYGLARIAVFRAAILMLFELLVAAISAWLLTEESMSGMEWLGGALIFIAAYGMARLGKMP